MAEIKSLKISNYNYTVNEFERKHKDMLVSVHQEDDVAVITIPNGRIKIMPKNKKPQPGYSIKHGGRATDYESGHPSWLLEESRLQHQHNVIHGKPVKKSYRRK
jgi:hypothetical protein